MEQARHIDVNDEQFYTMMVGLNEDIAQFARPVMETLILGDQQPNFTQRVQSKFLDNQEEQKYWLGQVDKLEQEIKEISRDAQKPIFIVPVGNGNSGKSTLLNAVVGSPEDQDSRLFNTAMGQCTSWRWKIVLRPDLRDDINFEAIVRTRYLCLSMGATEQIVDDQPLYFQSREQLIQMIREYQNQPESAPRSLSQFEDPSSPSDESGGIIGGIYEIEIRVRDQALLEHTNHILTQNLGILDFPGFNEAAHQQDIGKYIEDNRENLVFLHIVKLTIGGINELVQFDRLKFGNSYQPHTVIFTHFQAYVRSVYNEMRDQENAQAEVMNKVQRNIAQFATDLLKVLGPSTKFFIWDPFYRSNYFYRFSQVDPENPGVLVGASSAIGQKIHCKIQKDEGEDEQQPFHPIQDIVPLLKHLNVLLNTTIHEVKENLARIKLAQACEKWISDCESHFDEQSGSPDELLIQAKKSLQKRIKELKEQYTASGNDIIQEQVKLIRDQVDDLIKLNFGRTLEKGFDSQDFHNWISEHIQKLSIQWFASCEKLLQENVIKMMLKELQGQHHAIYDNFIKNRKKADHEYIIVDNRDILDDSLALWNDYAAGIQNSRMQRFLINPLRYGVFWGRKKDANKYLSKIKGLFGDQNLLVKAQKAFSLLIDEFFPLYYSFAIAALENIYRQSSGRDTRTRARGLEELTSIYFDKANQLVLRYKDLRRIL
ncbi:hypothetical protein FGO68_gene7607 [Halteria grandinella]|uniref:Uncharacterized protein n=1 Tax=Halteria grandinella TaxID=5974 RepID=A0A8J8P2K5_HALGN|nr:hypothetical protein FGO68_gene7607 [Halteria grandinella]